MKKRSRRHTCDNCGSKLSDRQIVPLKWVTNLAARLDSGSEVPSGECRKCGALTYLKRNRTVVITIDGGLAHVRRLPDGIGIVLIDYDTEGCDQEDLCRCKYGRKGKDHVHHAG